MKIGKYNYGLMLTVGAADAIAKMCPEKNIARLGDALAKGDVLGVTTEILVAMSNGRDDYDTLMGEAPDHPRMTKEIIMSLPISALKAAQTEILTQFKADYAATVEAEPSKKKESSALT